MSALAILFFLQWALVLSNAKLKNFSDYEPFFKCLLENAKAPVGSSPIHSVQLENVSPYQEADFSEIRQRLCGVKPLKASLFDQKSVEHQLLDLLDFDGNNASSAQYFRFALETCTTKAQVPLKCIEDEFSSIRLELQNCSVGNQQQVENYSDMGPLKLSTFSSEIPQMHFKAPTLEDAIFLDKVVSYFNIIKYLPEEYRKSIQQILNCCLREQILDSHYHLGTLVFTLPRLKSQIHVTRVSLNSMSRFDKYGSALMVPHKSPRFEITNPSTLLEILKQELISAIDSAPLDRLFLELNSHLLNAILAKWQKNGTEIFDLHPKEIADYSHRFEKLVCSGHPYYPFAKSKFGFSAEDVLNYSPEFQPTISLTLAAVHRSIVGVATNQQDFIYEDWFAEHYPEEWNRWMSALQLEYLHPEHYIPLPIHPWQISLVRRIFDDLIRAKLLVPLEQARLLATPTSSYRSLVPSRNLSAPYLKLPVSIQATSAVRSHPSEIVLAAPIISQFISDILSKERSISLNILREDIGVYLKDTDSREEHLSVSFRENILSCLKGQEIAVAVGALFEEVSGSSLFIQIMQMAGYADLQGAVQYFTRYVHLVVSSYLDLYLIYGIAMEGHQQNTLAVFEDGHIKRFVAKDLTGSRISKSVFNSHVPFRNISLTSVVMKNDEFIPRAKLLTTVYQQHLGELILHLADFFSCSEKVFWNVVKEKTVQRFEALRERVDTIRLKCEYEAILKKDWPGRSYLQNRFEKDYFEKGLYHFFKNPLN